MKREPVLCAHVRQVTFNLERMNSDIFALLNPVLVGITKYPTVCLICARKRAEYIENQVTSELGKQPTKG